MIPLWMFTLGQRYNDPDNNISVDVPFIRILQTVSLVVAPLFLGFFLNVKFPKVAAKFRRLITPAAVVTILFILTVGLYSNWYMLRLFRGGTVLAACLLPYAGYIVGAGLAFVSCQPTPRIKTVAIETGIQNTTVAYLMLTFSLPAPDADLAAVGSASSALMTPLPLLVLCIVYRVWLCRKRSKSRRADGPLYDDDNEAADGVKAKHDRVSKEGDVEMMVKDNTGKSRITNNVREKGVEEENKKLVERIPHDVNKNSKSVDEGNEIHG